MAGEREGGARLLVGFEGHTLPSEVVALANEGWLAGVVLFGRNLASEPQLAALVAEVHVAFAGRPTPIIAVDQEGGSVQRLKRPVVEVDPIPPMRSLAHLDAAGFEALGAAMAADLIRLGCNLDFAPVMDVDTNPANPVIASRAFGATPEEVSARALALARGLERGGVLWCAKHFPGHGDTSQDSHLTLPRVDHDHARLEGVELAPFRAAVAEGAPMIMTAHVVFAALDPDLPATLSPRVVPPLLRRAWGYDGVVASDDLDMLAIRDRFDVDAVARGLDAAEVDLALVCRDLAFARELAPRLSPNPAATRRLLALRERLFVPSERT